MEVNDLQRSVALILPPETRMTGFLDVVRWTMNRVRAHGNRLGGWSFDWTRGQLDFIATYDTGTIAISNGATTVTGTGTAFTDAMVGRKIRISGVGYVIASRATDTSIELASVYGAADETVATFTVYQDEYALDANISSIHRMWNKEDNKTIRAITPIALGDRDFLGERNFVGGSSRFIDVYADVGRNSSNQTLVQFHPFPTAIARIEYWYQADITQISGIGSTIDIPDFFDELVKQGVYARQMQVLRMNGWREERIDFNAMLQEAWEHDSVLRDEVIRIARSDDLEPFRFIIHEARNVTVL